MSRRQYRCIEKKTARLKRRWELAQCEQEAVGLAVWLRTETSALLCFFRRAMTNSRTDHHCSMNREPYSLVPRPRVASDGRVVGAALTRRVLRVGGRRGSAKVRAVGGAGGGAAVAAALLLRQTVRLVHPPARHKHRSVKAHELVSQTTVSLWFHAGKGNVHDERHNDRQTFVSSTTRQAAHFLLFDWSNTFLAHRGARISFGRLRDKVKGLSSCD